MKKNKLLLVPILIIFKCFSATAQFTTIPDSNFETILRARNLDGTGATNDGKVLTSLVATATFLNVTGRSIKDLTGIQDFVALNSLQCNLNQLTSLDLTKNTALNSLYCNSNQLTFLDVTKNTVLKTLDCNSNQLTVLDVTKNTALNSLDCDSNQLTILDVTKNTALNRLYCDSNQLTSLDVTKNTTLNYLNCSSNQLTFLDVTKNSALITLSCSSNQLTALDVSKNITLPYLYCYSNQLTAMDLTKNSGLVSFNCSSNKLVSLNMKNGENGGMTLFNTTNNPNLTCIQVDNTTGLQFGWVKDPSASYSTNCSLAAPSFEKDETSVLIYPNPAANLINIELEDITASKVTILDMNGRKHKSVNILDKKTAINISNLVSGTYLMQITTDKGTVSKKIVKQ